MRHLFASLVLALLLSAGASLPAAAEYGVGGGGVSASWSEGVAFPHYAPAERPQRQRLARASYGESYYDDDEVTERPRQRAKKRAHGKRYGKRRGIRSAKHTRRHQRAVRKPAAQQRKLARPRPKPAEQQAAAPATPAPGWSKKSLGSDGQKRKDLGGGSNQAAKAPGARGVASFYWQPQRVASGGWFNPNAMTAAHKTLPFGTRVRVTHLGNGRSVEVKINDRGPYIAGRIIDLSKAAAGIIGMTGQGIARVAVEVLGR